MPDALELVALDRAAYVGDTVWIEVDGDWHAGTVRKVTHSLAYDQYVVRVVLDGEVVDVRCDFFELRRPRPAT